METFLTDCISTSNTRGSQAEANMRSSKSNRLYLHHRFKKRSDSF